MKGIDLKIKDLHLPHAWILKFLLIVLFIPMNCRADVDSLKALLRTTSSILEKIDVLI